MLLVNPQKFSDLHLSLYHLTIRNDGKLAVHSVVLNIPELSPSVRGVRIVPDGADDGAIAAVIMVDTDVGIFAWRVNRDFIVTPSEAFSSANVISYHPIVVDPCLHASKAGSLSSVAPVITDDHLSGVNMVKDACLICSIFVNHYFSY